MKDVRCVLILLQLLEAYAEFNFRHLAENQLLDLSCSPQLDLGGPTGLNLHHRSARSQTTVLSVAEGGELRVNPEHRGRVQLRGGLDSLQVNVTISQLKPSDTGLYMWELSYRTEEGSAVVSSTQRIFLLVEAAGSSCHCSQRYLPLTLVIFTAAGLLLVTLSCLAIERCGVKLGAPRPDLSYELHPRPPPTVPIYEEMTRKQQRAGISQNNYEPPSHLEEEQFPVYANPSIKQPQEEYYASPRQLGLRAPQETTPLGC